MNKVIVHEVFAEAIKRKGKIFDHIEDALDEYSSQSHFFFVVNQMHGAHPPRIYELEEGFDGVANAIKYIRKEPRATWYNWKFMVINQATLQHYTRLNEALQRGLGGAQILEEENVTAT